MSGPQPGTPVEMLSWLLDAAEKEWLLAADVQDGRIRGASTAFARLLGHTRATLQGEPLVRVVLSPDTSTLLEHCLAGKKQATVVQLLHAKGPTIPVEAKCHLVHDGDPSAGTLLLAARTLAADGAADGSEQLDRYFDAGLDLHCIADTQGYFRRLSAQWEETLGYSRDELVGARFLDYVHPDDVESTLEAMATLRSQQSVLNFENRYRCRDGTYRWLEWRSLPVGETVYAAARDITRRKRMEQELRDNREQLRQAKHLLESVLDAIPDVIGIQDRHHRMIRYNRAGYELLGIRPEEAAGRLCFELIGRDRPCDECATTAALVTSKPSRAERYLAAAGMWLDCRSYPVVDGGAVEYVVEHLRDVSELKLAEQKLRATEQRLAHVQKMDAIGQLAGGIAHDFNNQLAGVVGSADLLRLELEDRPELRALAENILLAARRAGELTAQLLAFARKGKYQAVQVNLHDIVGEVISILKHSIDKRIRIQEHLDASNFAPRGDPTQIQSALLNLALNARDAMPDGGQLVFRTDNVEVPESSTEVGTFDIAPGRYVVATVSDTGIGIPVGLQGRIFEPFFTTKAEGRGTGMGLAAVYGTMQHHCGAVRVTSSPGKGSSFALYFPVTDRADPATTESEPPARKHTDSRHILLVDDEDMVRLVATSMLNHLGHQVTSCENGRQAVAIYQHAWSSIDVVILDMVMPEMDGEATYDALRGINPQALVLVSSGYTIDDKIQALLDAGVAGFIQKPFTIHELTTKLDAVLRGD